MRKPYSIYFHRARYRNFKAFYLLPVCPHCRGEFPNLLSDNRFVALIPTARMPLCIYLHTRRGKDTGIAFINATSLVVCHNRRIHSHQVFKPGGPSRRQNLHGVVPWLQAPSRGQ